MGYTAIVPMQMSNATDALFRGWGSMINTQLAAMGWVNTSDTGQINWTTVITTVGVNEVKGYEIWRMNDALQSTVPIFMKLEYGSGNGATCPGLWVTLGTGSNGTGSLTGVTSIRQQISGAGVTASVTNNYFCGDTNRFWFALFGLTAANCELLSVERTVDSAGDLTGEGALMIERALSAWKQVHWNAVLGQPTATWETTIGALVPLTAPLGVYGTQVAVYPIYHHKGIFLDPGLNALTYFDATMGQLSPLTLTHYGASHTYLPLGLFFPGADRSSSATACLMVRWE